MGGERGSGISVLMVRRDVDDSLRAFLTDFYWLVFIEFLKSNRFQEFHVLDGLDSYFNLPSLLSLF